MREAAARLAIEHAREFVIVRAFGEAPPLGHVLVEQAVLQSPLRPEAMVQAGRPDPGESRKRPAATVALQIGYCRSKVGE